jgi:uncharacterized tellurite resistance protein B-like protein
MFNFIRQTLTNSLGTPENVQDDNERTKIAAGVIFLEAAHADDECTDDELGHAIETLCADFDLSRKHAEELLELAHQERDRAVDLYEFTSHINNEFSRDERRTVLEKVWRIIYIDGQLEKHEDHFIRKLTHLLRLSHKDMIDAKLKAKEQMQ